MNNLLKSIAEHEGFRHVPYPDPLSGGEPYTFGHGLTYISFDESIMLVNNRITIIKEQLNSRLPFFSKLPDDAKDILIEMAYQMGVDGLLKFKNTLGFVAEGDYLHASKNMMLSKWAEQTPKRAKTLADRMAKIKG